MNKLLLLIALCLAGCADSALLPWNNQMTAGAFPSKMRYHSQNRATYVPVYVGGSGCSSGDSQTADAINNLAYDMETYSARHALDPW